MTLRTPSFDSQAQTYDQRVGLAEKDCQAIAKKVLTIAKAQPGDLVVEVGAGTGAIGQWFVQPSVRYLGFDLSPTMLAVFRERLKGNREHWTLLEADGNQKWPLADGSARVIFSSRSLHLLDSEHAVNESFRIARPEAAVLLLGSVQRQPDSVKVRMKQQMQRLLRQRGFQEREQKRSQEQLMVLCSQRGTQEIKPVVVSQWTVENTPQQSLDNWQQKPGLAGIDLPCESKQEILEELRLWAQKSFGGLDRAIASKEAYVLQGVDLYPTDKVTKT